METLDPCLSGMDNPFVRISDTDGVRPEMMKTSQTFVGATTLALVCVLLGALYHLQIGIIAAFAVLVLATGIEVFRHVQRKSLLKSLEALNEEERKALWEAVASKGSTRDFREILTPELSLTGKALNVVLGFAALFGPPFAYHLLSGRVLSWDAPFTGAHLGRMIAGMGAYLACRGKLLAGFMESEERIRQLGPGGPSK